MVLQKLGGTLADLPKHLAGIVLGPAGLCSLPALCLLAFWLGGEVALIALALACPLLFVVSGGAGRTSRAAFLKSAVSGTLQRDTFKEIVANRFDEATEAGLKSAMFQMELDDKDVLVERYGQSGADQIAQKTADRINAVFRDTDAVCQTDRFQYAVCLAPVAHLDLELCIQLSGRLQSAVEEPISLDGTSVFITVSVGFCLHSRMIKRTGTEWQKAAGYAMREAQHNGPSAIRAFSDDMYRKTEVRAELREEVARALEEGQIQPWFQPQISTDTGLVTGFEALARWNHPKKGMIAPSAFLPAIEQARMLERLAEVMLFYSLTALKAWDRAGVDVPQVGVNFAGPELSNPKLMDKIAWELDRFELAPERLAVEVLETVVASAPDDTITRNINGLSEMGCQIDLDDFGTGHASITSIRRFSVNRIKIDRSFVIKADRDVEQQRMISAILTMAERLEVETLAEGVETVGEHALLAQLGCTHVQGFGIGKPMPFDQTLDWIKTHNSKLQATPQIFRNKSI